jgi:ABC-2 type transport system ATP-binding protein
LTTQDLEEAETLAERVGIIHHGRMVAEGPPAALRRSLGADVVTVKVDDGRRARAALETMPGLSAIGGDGNEVRCSAVDGASLVGPMSVHLDRHGVSVREVAVRTPTLGDVFLQATGARLGSEGAP